MEPLVVVVDVGVTVTVHPERIRSIVDREADASTVAAGTSTGKSCVQRTDKPVDAVLKITNRSVCRRQPVARAARPLDSTLSTSWRQTKNF